MDLLSFFIFECSMALFQPLQVGDIQLAHRVVLAPLTRYRADNDHVHHGQYMMLRSRARLMIKQMSRACITSSEARSRAAF